MRDSEIGIGLGCVSIDRVEFSRRVVRRTRPLITLVRLVRRCRRHQCDSAFRQRFLQRRKRDVLILRPTIRLPIPKSLIIRSNSVQIWDRQIILSANPNSFSAADILVSHTGRSDLYDRYKPSALNRPNRQYFLTPFPQNKPDADGGEKRLPSLTSNTDASSLCSYRRVIG